MKIVITDSKFRVALNAIKDHIENASIIFISIEGEESVNRANRIRQQDGVADLEFEVDLFDQKGFIENLVLEVEVACCGATRVELLGNDGGSLHIRDDQDYEERFMLRNRSVKQKIGRVNEPLGDFFVAAQVQRNEQISREFRSGAAVIMAYKAIELEVPALKAFAGQALQCNIDNNAECGDHWHPRRNKEHLLASMLCARWHLELCDESGEPDVIIDTFEDLWRRSSGFESFRTAAYPITTSLLVYVFILASRGQDAKAQDLITYMVEVYKQSVMAAKIGQLTLFNELAKSHKCAVLAEELRRSVNANNLESYAGKVLNTAFRCPDQLARAVERLSGIPR